MPSLISQTPTHVSTLTKDFLAVLMFVNTDTCVAQLLTMRENKRRQEIVNFLRMLLLTSKTTKSNI